MSSLEFAIDVFDPYDVDREEFNPAMCMLKYSQECRFSDIMVKKSRVEREIGILNSDLKNLMYDNYKKLDKVTYVIENMKSNFQKMQEEMDYLYDKMNGVARTSSRILENLQPVENKTRKLLKVQNAVKKLDLLTNLVPTLKAYVDSGVPSVAARYYLKAEKVLKKYIQLPSLCGIVNDCSEIVVEIKSGLRSKLTGEMYGEEELLDNLNLLLGLGETPDILLEHFLFYRDKCLAKLLISMDEIWAKDVSKASESHFLNKVNSYIDSCCTYVEKMSNALKVAKDVFQSEKDFKTNCLSKSLEEFFVKNMGCLRTKLLHYIKECIPDIDDNSLSQFLDKFIRKCHESGIIKTRINFYYEGLDIVLQVCTCRCENYLKTMKEDFNIQLGKQVNDLLPRTNIPNLVLFFVKWTEQKLMSVLLSVVCYIRPEFRCCREVTFRKVFCKVVVREGTFVAFLRHIIEQIWLFVTVKNVNHFTKPLLCAVFAKFLLDFSDVVPEFLSKVDERLNSTDENLTLTSVKVITTEFKTAALKVVHLYIEIRCLNITHMIQKSMENRDWMASKEPTRPRAVIKMVLNDLLEAKSETEKIFGACHSPVRKRGSDIVSAVLCEMYHVDSTYKRNIIEEKVILNKLFLECSASSIKVELNTPSIMNTLLKTTLNTFIQLIRLKTLNHFSLQQIQVDVCYLQCHLSKLIELHPVVQSLFDEIMASACNRTVNPQLMNSQVVSVICNNVL